MRRALTLAARAEGRTAPNPLVGAVVVKNGQLVAEGYHKGPGRPHAEAEALKRAGAEARGAVLYVTLEPCVHTGKRTPPCVPQVASAGLSRVVVGAVDPNPKVAGGGIAALQSAGVDVEVGCLKERCRKMNAPYEQTMKTGLPWVTVKSAQTLDGKVATASGESKWITGDAARRHGHRMRGKNDIILTGIGTVLADDPELTCRIRGRQSPVRVVVDAGLATPPAARVLTGTAAVPTILATVAGADPDRAKKLEAAGARILTVPEQAGHPAGGSGGSRIDLVALLKMLAEEGHHRVLAEGGPTVAAGLFAAGLVNRVAWFVAPSIMGGDDARGSVGGNAPKALAHMTQLGPIKVRRLGADLLLEADVIKS